MSYAEKPDDVTKEEWMEKLNNVHIQRADMNRLIMNYLVTGETRQAWDPSEPSCAPPPKRSLGVFSVSEGFKEAAEKFRMESGIEPSVDLDTLDERIKIREMILKGQIQGAIALINSLHPELLDTNRYLYFHLQVGAPAVASIVANRREDAKYSRKFLLSRVASLAFRIAEAVIVHVHVLFKMNKKENLMLDLISRPQQQHLIELIRLRETESALEFAQTQLAEQGEESRECLTEMERTLALLAFDNPEESPFGDLLNMMQRQKVGGGEGLSPAKLHLF